MVLRLTWVNSVGANMGFVTAFRVRILQLERCVEGVLSEPRQRRNAVAVHFEI
jgi:hypothetical protein